MYFFTYLCSYQVSDKGLLWKCGNGKSFLAEIGTFQPNLRDGVQKEPKFELDSLKIKVQAIIWKRIRRSFKIESSGSKQKGFGLAVELHNKERVKPGKVGKNSKNRKVNAGKTERHFVQEGKPEYRMDYWKVYAVEG